MRTTCCLFAAFAVHTTVAGVLPQAISLGSSREMVDPYSLTEETLSLTNWGDGIQAEFMARESSWLWYRQPLARQLRTGTVAFTSVGDQGLFDVIDLLTPLVEKYFSQNSAVNFHADAVWTRQTSAVGIVETVRQELSYDGVLSAHGFEEKILDSSVRTEMRSIYSGCRFFRGLLSSVNSEVSVTAIIWPVVEHSQPVPEIGSSTMFLALATALRRR